MSANTILKHLLSDHMCTIITHTHACTRLFAGASTPPPSPALSVTHTLVSSLSRSRFNSSLSDCARVYIYTHTQREAQHIKHIHTYARQLAALFQRTSICVHLSCSILLSLALSCSLSVCVSVCRCVEHRDISVCSHTHTRTVRGFICSLRAA